MKRNRLMPPGVLTSVLVITLILVLPTQTFAWGDKGHQIIGALAWSKLSDSAKAQINKLIPEAANDPNGPLAAIGPWADRQALANPDERRWHFVQIGFWEEGYNEERDCRSGDCIVVKLNEKKNLLQSSSNRRVRAEALKYVVHFVGDIHQPLHCIDRDDNSGNSLLVRFMGERTNLHKVWDDDMIDRTNLSVGDFAKKLQSLEVTKGYWLDRWATDSHETAKRYVYGLPKDNELRTDYYSRNLPILERQLALAAQKLADILEETMNRSSPSKMRH